MNAFLLHLWVQFRMDARERGTLLTFYAVPLIFFVVMGAVFSSINPTAKETLAASMSIFAVTMGAVLGAPIPLVKMRESGVLRAYRVSGVPSRAVLLIQEVSAFFHLLLVSAVIFAAAPLLFGAGLPRDYTGYFIILLIYIFASIALGLLIGVTARSQSMATMLSQAVFLPSLLLSGIMFPASMLPKPLLWLGRIFPATHAMQSFSVLAYHLKANYSGALALGITACSGMLAMGIAVWRFEAAGREELG